MRVTLQVPLPEHPPPLQPAKREPAEAEAVNPTTVFTSVLLMKAAEHAEPQVMPDGLLVTRPLPAPVLLTVSV